MSLYMNLVSHRREKPGVEVLMLIRTAEPLTAAAINRLRNLAQDVDAVFDSIPSPDQPTGDAE